MKIRRGKIVLFSLPGLIVFGIGFLFIRKIVRGKKYNKRLKDDKETSNEEARRTDTPEGSSTVTSKIEPKKVAIKSVYKKPKIVAGL